MDGFRIQKITVEGFKGFTSRQTFELDGRHVFVLGPNAHGKSSLIEAIRWGLFGSTRRQGESVANTRYVGHCQVEIDLLKSGVPLRIRRVLSRGSGGRTDAEVIDEDGETHSIREVLPQLDSASAGENVHVIYAPQSGTRSRAPDDLEPFERTVYSHLGLTDARSLITVFDRFQQEQESLERVLGEQIDEVRSDQEKEILDLKVSRGRILDLTPWGSGPVPSVGETDGRIKNFISRVGSSQEPASGTSTQALLDGARTALRSLSAKNVDDLEEERDKQIMRQKTLKDLLAEFELIELELERDRKSLDTAEATIAEVTGGSSVEEFKQQRADLLAGIEDQVLSASVASQAAILIRNSEAESAACPVCRTIHPRSHLLELIDPESLTIDLEKRKSDVDSVDKSLEQIALLQNEILNGKTSIESLNERNQDVINRIKLELDVEDSNSYGQHVKSEIARSEKRLKELDHLLNESESLIAREALTLENLEQEAKFHIIQKKIREVERIHAATDEAQSSLDTLVKFGETMTSINESVNEVLVEWLKNQLPRVTAPMSEAFVALTSHPVYDRLIVPEDDLPIMKLKVSSTVDPSEISNPEDVLNGQALSALELVPYFALGQLKEAPVEVYSLLLDDPTQAFDPAHIDLLGERLASLGQTTQLIVASHEVEHFERLVDSNFEPNSYRLLKVDNYSRSDGPDFTTIN